MTEKNVNIFMWHSRNYVTKRELKGRIQKNIAVFLTFLCWYQRRQYKASKNNWGIFIYKSLKNYVKLKLFYVILYWVEG